MPIESSNKVAPLDHEIHTDGAVFVGSEKPPGHVSEKLTALHASSSTKYQTIDFEEPDHEVLRMHYSQQTKRTMLGQDFAHYLLSLVMVIIISLLFLGLTYSTEHIAELRLEKMHEFWEHGENGTATLFAIGTAIGFVIVPALLVVFVAPAAIGSGMTEVIAFLNGASAMHGITLTVLAVKYLGVMAIVSAGLFSGIDGPMSEIGAGIAMIMVRQATTWTWFRKLFFGETLDLGLVNDKSDRATELKANTGSDAIMDSDSTHDAEAGETRQTVLNHHKLADSLLGFLQHKSLRLFATIGSAVSIAVIFRAPIGGVLFAVEEATSFFELSLLIKLTFATVVGYIIVAFATFGIAEHIPISNVFLNPVTAALFPVNSNCQFEMRLPMIGTYILIGVCAGLFGQCLNMVLSKIQKTRQKYLIEPEVARKKEAERTGETPKPVHKGKNAVLRIAEVAAIATLTALVVCWIPTSPKIEKCQPFSTLLSHLGEVRPECDFMNPLNPLTCPNLLTCRDTLASQGMCLPAETELEFNNFVVETYESLCASHESQAATSSGSHGSTPESAPTTEHVPTTEPHSTAHSTRSFNSQFKRSLIWASLPTSNLTTDTFTFPFKLESDGFAELLMVNEEEHCYYQMRSLFWSSPERQLKMMLLRGVFDIWEVTSLLVFLSVYLVMSCITYYIALPTDLVVPNLIIGATAGRILGLLLNLVHPGYVDPGAFALIGMAALWSGTSGLVLTVTAVALEMTGDFSYLPALIIVTFTSAWVSNSIGPSLYHIEMENNGAPYLPSEPNTLLRTITTKQIMSKHTVALGTAESLETVHQLLQETKFMGYPVVQKYNIGSNHEHRATEGAPHATGHTHSIKYRPVGFVTRSRLRELLEEMETLHFSPTSTVDIESIAGSNPLTVREDSTASKVYSLFRQLGLKRVFVVDVEGFLVGMVVRRDLIRPVEEKEEREEEEERGEVARDLRELARKLEVRAAGERE
ncbi:hypothetical protein HDU98_008100 [Podochytrium sp. JEL0797]|nr:hypothetical protein HDU98_008100 [Podochytrium sp. JEL0797]